MLRRTFPAGGTSGTVPALSSAAVSDERDSEPPSAVLLEHLSPAFVRLDDPVATVESDQAGEVLADEGVTVPTPKGSWPARNPESSETGQGSLNSTSRRRWGGSGPKLNSFRCRTSHGVSPAAFLAKRSAPAASRASTTASAVV